MAEIWRLFQLQKIDTQLMQYSKEIRELKSDEAHSKEVAKHREIFEAKDKSLKNAKKSLKEKESDESTLQAKRKELNDKVYGGTISNPKEIVTYQQELKKTDDKISLLEADIIQLMEDIEVAEEETSKLKDSLELMERDSSQTQGAIDRKIVRIKVSAQKLLAQREQIIPLIDPRLLHQYDQLRKAKNGIAVAEVINRSCSGCHMKLTDYKIQEVKNPGENISTCGTCRRILFMQR